VRVVETTVADVDVEVDVVDVVVVVGGGDRSGPWA